MRHNSLQPKEQGRETKLFRTTLASWNKQNSNSTLARSTWLNSKAKSPILTISSDPSQSSPALTLNPSVASKSCDRMTTTCLLSLLWLLMAQGYPAHSQEKVSPAPQAQASTLPVLPPPSGEQHSPDSEKSDQSGSISGEPSEQPLLGVQEPLDFQGESSEESSAQSVDEPDKLPASDPNPLNSDGNSLDALIQRGINTDLWQQMKGELQCVDATTECIAQLQATAVQQNPLLMEVDSRIEEIKDKIVEAKATNKKSINLSILRPAARVFVEPSFDTPAQPRQRQRGPIEKLLSIFTSPGGVFNELIKAVGIPLVDKLVGGNDQNQNRAIAISDLQVKLAEIERGRAQLADQVKEKVALAVFDFDTYRREFQISQEIAKRESQRIHLSEVEYRLGENDSVTYLGQLSSLDRNKAATWRSWASMRLQMEKIKLLVLGTSE